MRSKLALPPWLIALDMVAVLLIGAGLVRLQAPDLAPLDQLSEQAAWVCIAAGGLCLAAFWIYLVRSLRARRAGS